MAYTEYIVSLARIAKLIEDNGGKIVDLDDGKLTHIILDKRDDSRRRELMKRTSKYVHVHFRFIAVLIRICTLVGQSIETSFSPISSRRASRRIHC